MTDFNIAQSWDQVSLEDFCKIQETLEDVNLNELDKEIKVLCILSGVADTYFDSWFIPEIKALFKKIKFLDEEPKGDIQDYYKIGDKKYKLIRQVKDLTAGQFIDLIHYTKDKDLILDNLSQICSILLLPTKPLTIKQRINNWWTRFLTRSAKGKRVFNELGIVLAEPKPEKYLETPLEITADNIFKNLSVSQAFGISLFFCLLLEAFCQATNSYLETQMIEKLKLTLPHLEKMNSQKAKETVKEIQTLIGISPSTVSYAV